MSSNFNYTDYINSLIQFIWDAKPYHSKLTDVIEEYHFVDAFTATFDDSQHFISTKAKSVWLAELYSDGMRTNYKLPTQLVLPRHSNNISQSFHDTSHLDGQIPNLTTTHSAYQTFNDDGIRYVSVNNSPKIENLDYFVSQGAVSFQLKKVGSSYFYREFIQDRAGTTGFGWKAVADNAIQVVSPAAPVEVWTLIKINPIAYTRPILFTNNATGHTIGYDNANYDSGGDDISCTQDGPDADNLYASGGYSVGELYDDSVNCFDIANINFLPAEDAPSEMWTLTAVSGTEFSVVGSVSGDQPHAFIGVPYNNGIVSFTINVTNPAFTAIPGIDQFVFEALNPTPIVNFYPEKFWYSPAEQWIVSAISADEFTVFGTVSGKQPNAFRNIDYDNGIISFKIIADMPFEPKQGFIFNVITDRPSYLVHGSISGMQKPLTVGVPYNNGIVAFNLPLPIYKNLKNDSSGALSFDRVPRPDTSNEKYSLVALTPSTLQVTTSRRGIIKGAVCGVPYQDDFVSFTVTGTLIPGETLEFETVQHQFPPVSAKDVVIFGDTRFNGTDVVAIDSVLHVGLDTIQIDEVRFDEFTAQYIVPSDLDTALGAGTNGTIPTILDKATGTIKLANVSPSTPTVDTLCQILSDGYVTGFDQGFVTNYLKLNVGLDVTVTQKDIYNNRAATLISDDIRFADSFKFYDSFGVDVTDALFFSGQTGSISEYLDDDVRIKVGEKSYFATGYDIFPYDEEPTIENSAYDYTDLVELGSQLGIGMIVTDKQANSMGPKIGDNSFTIFVAPTPSNFDMVSLDASSFDNLVPAASASVFMTQVAHPTPGSPFYGNPMLDPVAGTAMLSYVTVSNPLPSGTVPITSVTVDYLGTDLSFAPNVFIVNNLIDKTILEVVNPFPLRTGTSAYNSFRLDLTTSNASFVIVISV